MKTIFQQTYIISVSKAVPSYNVSEVCINHMLRILQHVIMGSPWALKMLDSSSKIPVSILEGNVIEYGNYDECLNIKVKEDWGSFIGQHCLNIFILTSEIIQSIFHTNVSQEIPLSFSLCIPSSCTPEELQFMLSKLSDNIIVDPDLCHTSQQAVPFHTVDWIAIMIITILGLLCLFSTSYELLVENKEKCPAWVRVFSWYSNGKKLFEPIPPSDPLRALQGLRFISIMWIVIGHAYINNKLPSINLLSKLEQSRDWWHMIPLNAVYGVDTFFVISGMLLCYTFMKSMESGSKFNLPVFYLHRYFRITPMLAMIVLIHIAIIPRLGDGPMWNIIQCRITRQSCVTDWWNTLLYIHNYYHSNIRDMCVGTSWYLAADMQLFWLSPVLLFMLKKRPKIGVIIIFIGTMAGMVINFVNAYVNKINLDVITIDKNFHESNYRTHTRFIPWLLGLLSGYIFYKTINWRAKLLAGTATFPRRYIISGWLLAAGCMIVTGISAYPFQQKNYKYNVLDVAFYSALTRPLWSLGIIWVIFSCASGFGGFVNTLLSWEFFHPLGRLSFAIYLIHMDFIFEHIASRKATFYMSDMEGIEQIFGDMVMTIFVSIIMSLSIEAPFITIEKMLFHRGRRRQSLQIKTKIEDRIDMSSTEVSLEIIQKICKT